MLSRLRAVARLLAPSPAGADDLLARSMEAARTSLNGGVSGPWLEAMAVDRMLALHDVDGTGELPAVAPCAAVAARLRVLSRDERFAFLMIDVLGRSCDDAAKAIGQSAPAVEDALARARGAESADAD